ncbi:MAG: 50S ribosomal protein L6 [Alphaproteobacteria bacterium]|jgi:large subunit ribosomal protein L6|nr:50S ribosomal protein L6 [Alphaproteobacteria bacterium]
MSRIGLKPIPVPDGVTVEISGKDVSAKGKIGTLSLTLVEEVSAAQADGKVVVTPQDDTVRARSMWGMQRTMINNMITGVSAGFEKNLEIQGVGYRAAVKGKNLQLQLGFSHDVLYPIPEGIKITCEKPTMVKIFGANRQQVGQIAAEIRAYRPPEPYKGKGVRYLNEQVFRKEGKKK